MAIAVSGSSSDGNNLSGTSSSTTTITTTTTTTTGPDDAGRSGGGSGSSEGMPNKHNATGTSSSSASLAGTNAAGKKVANEMVGGCAVCLDDNGTEENQLVYCDGCELPVHQACYGIAKIPEGSWFCCRCSSDFPKDKIKCHLCPEKSGALKKTESRDTWAHVLCALYIPEVEFGDINIMEPIILTKIIKERYDKLCYICEDSNNLEAARSGAKIRCNHKNGCKRFFHVTCAHAAGLCSEESSPGVETLNYYAYCKQHFRKSKASNNNNKKNKSNFSSLVLDSASDSSQDNDSHRNNAIEQQDKSNSDRTKVLPPTNYSQSDAPSTTTFSQSSTSLSPSLTTSKLVAPPANASGTGLTVPSNSISGNGSKSNSASTPSTTPQKKKRATKSAQGQSNTVDKTNKDSEAPLGTNSNRPVTQQRTLNNLTPGALKMPSVSAQDVYDWPSGVKDSERNAATPNKSTRKKPAAPNTQSLSSKSVSSSDQQVIATSYNPNKIGSPNLSISTSPSLASPSSSSSKSTSNASTSSTTVTAASNASSSSSSSTTSSSPSPALISPSTTNRGPTTRLESPLASNSKPSSNTGNKFDPILPMNHVTPALNPLISTRINLDNPRTDLKKSMAASSSLLSTTVSMSSIDSSMQLTMGPAGDASASSRTGAPSSTDAYSKESSTTTSTTTSKPDTAQPTIPPLIIPVPQGSATNSMTKTVAKTRAPARNTKKKAAELNAVAPKPEPKPKPSRSRKVTSAENGASAPTPAPTPQKAEPKPRKGRANAKAAEAVASSSNTKQDEALPKTPAASGPNKRKSRATSAESNPSTTPTPAKRIRKKKTDTPASSIELKSTPQTALTLPTNPQSSMNHPVGPGPLMITTPAQNNPLPPGFSAAENQSVGTKYFSPMVSPYANYDGQMAASSLSRSSLSRLFTSSSSGSNPTNQPLDDPTKAFDDLRDHSWSQLSKCVLDQAQQFDIPLLIGTLYTLRAENEKLQNRVRDLTQKKDQLGLMNARLDMSPHLLTQNLTNTNPNFSSVVSSLTSSPKGLPMSSPGSALGKQPLVITSSYNHMGPGHIGHPGFMDRSSPLVAQTHSTINNMRSSSISTPSPPINALVAAHNNSNRAGLTVNQPYMPNSYPQMNATGQINSTPHGSSFYARQ